MKVRELIDILNAFDEDLPVSLMIDEEQAMSSIRARLVKGNHDVPYAKGDNIYKLYGLQDDQQVVMIMGFF